MPQAVRRKKNESQKPAPKKKQTQASQHTVTAGGGPQEEVNPRQVLMQSQHNPMGSGAQKTKPKLHNSTPSPRGYVGRNDGQVQQSTAGKPGGLSSGGNYSITSGHWDPASSSQKDKGKVKGSQQITAQGVKSTPSPGNLTTKAKPSKIWSAKAGALVNRQMSPAGQGQGQTTKGQRVLRLALNSWRGSSLHR